MTGGLPPGPAGPVHEPPIDLRSVRAWAGAPPRERVLVARYEPAPGLNLATRSISTRAPRGRAAAWTVERAGRCSPMASP